MVNAKFTGLTKTIGQVSPLLAEALNHLADAVDDAMRQAREAEARLQALEDLVGRVARRPRTGEGQEATALERMLGDLLRGQQDQQTWLANLSQQLTSARLSADELTSGEYIVHEEIGSRFREFITQQLLDAAATAGPADLLAEAGARADLARALFDGDLVAKGQAPACEWLRGRGVQVTAERFHSLWETAQQIRDDAAASGHRCGWRFDAEPGARLDPSWQQACDGCDPDDPVAFAVAPAYVVDGKVYAGQVVFTQPAQRQARPAEGEPREEEEVGSHE